ncbi:OmpP1/FadL family transporter [Cetobacterium sp.]|uniref:OmpP1/FadL family transporter n=1 Tax=Cetobacterium sp. TaxID=2071632 RepID=UPI002FC6CE46
MKKIIIFVIISKLSLALGGIEIGTAPSVISVANPSQTANITVQSPFFNPAATMFLENGQHLYLGAFGVFPDYETQYNGQTFLKTTTFQPVPSFSYINKKDSYSYFIASGSLGQGGFLKYSVSYNAIDDFHLTAINPGVILGGSFFISKNISAGISARIIYSKLEAKGDIKNEGAFRSYIEATGIAPEISLLYTPTEKLNLGIKYLAKTKLDYDGKVKEGSKIIINKVFGKFSVDNRKDFPAVLSLGSLYKITEEQRFSLGFNWIMESEKTIDHDLYHKYKDTYEYGIGFEQDLNEKMTAILGYGYTDKGTNGHIIGDMTQLDSQQLGLGFKYKYSEATNLYTAFGINFYKTDNSELYGETITTKRKELIFGMGLETKL